MLTRLTPLLPKPPTLKGDPVKDAKVIEEHLRLLNKVILDTFARLNLANVLAIEVAQIDSTPIGSQEPATGAFTTLSASGDVEATGSGKRFKADFSNATRANRYLFVDSTTNNGTNVGVIPNGTSAVSAWTAFGGSDPDNTHLVSMGCGTTTTTINSTKAGTGTQRDLDLQIGGSTKAKIDAATGALRVLDGDVSAPGFGFINRTDSGLYWDGTNFRVVVAWEGTEGARFSAGQMDLPNAGTLGGYSVNGTKVIGTRKTGYSAMTGTANRATAYDTSTITLAQLAQRVKALQDDFTTHGLIGA